MRQHQTRLLVAGNLCILVDSTVSLTCKDPKKRDLIHSTARLGGVK